MKPRHRSIFESSHGQIRGGNPVYAFFQTPAATGISVIRLTLGVYTLFHGLRHLFGWFEWSGMTHFLDPLLRGQETGISPIMIGGVFVLEILTGLGLILGLFTRLWALVFTGAFCSLFYFGMVPAAGHELELYLLLGICGFSVLLSGGGRFSLDHQITSHLLP